MLDANDKDALFGDGRRTRAAPSVVIGFGPARRAYRSHHNNRNWGSSRHGTGRSPR